MELFSYNIPWKSTKSHDPIVICPLGDIQWAGVRGSTAKELLKEHIARCVELGGWFIGTGDFIDFASPSNRQRLSAAALYDTATDVIDDKALDLVQELYDLFLRPTVGRWLAYCEGHHFANLRSGDTTDMRLCQMLKAPFAGTSAFVRLVFTRNQASRYTQTLFVHHGCGGGMKVSGPLNKLENLTPYFDADIYIMGHSTKQAAAPLNCLTPRWHGMGSPDIVSRTKYLVSAGGFSRGYIVGNKQGQVNRGSYVEQAMMAPAALGAPLVKIYPELVWKRAKNKESSTWAPRVAVET